MRIVILLDVTAARLGFDAGLGLLLTKGQIVDDALPDVEKKLLEDGLAMPEDKWLKQQKAVPQEVEMPKALERVLALDGPHLSQIVESWGMKLPSVSYLMFCNNHMIHHRGQLTTYIRPTGGKVPAMYGESFDQKMGG